MKHRLFNGPIAQERSMNVSTSVMVVSRISVWNVFIEEARTLGLLAFFTIAEQVAGEAHNIPANPRIAVRMHSRTDSKARTNANYGQLKIHKRSQNFSFLQLFVGAYMSSDHTLWKQKQKKKSSRYQLARHSFFNYWRVHDKRNRHEIRRGLRFLRDTCLTLCQIKQS